MSLRVHPPNFLYAHWYVWCQLGYRAAGNRARDAAGRVHERGAEGTQQVSGNITHARTHTHINIQRLMRVRGANEILSEREMQLQGNEWMKTHQAPEFPKEQHTMRHSYCAF